METAQAIQQKYSNRLCELLKTGDLKNLIKGRFFKIDNHNPKDIVFQHIAAKEKVCNDRTNRYEKINIFGNGYITQHLTFVDIEKLKWVLL